MRILILGDTHISDRRPERRKDDDYFQTFITKLSQVRDIYHKMNCEYLLQVGDFFDSYNVSKEVIAGIIEFLKNSNMNVACIWGQHDISGHSGTTFRNSPLRILESAGVVKILNDYRRLCYVGLCVTGQPFGQEILPSIKDEIGYDYKILVVHQMVGDQPLFPGHDIKQPKQFLKEHPEFNLILCGDYHYRFIVEDNGRFCINPGAMVRKTIGKRDLELEPAVIFFDTSDCSYEVVKLDVVPSEDIFDFSKEEIVNKKDTSVLDAFLENLNKQEGTKIGWKELLQALMIKRKTNVEVKEVIEKSIEECSKI
jgi:DNA repair exonuclease SbcCD nuclease subunit